MAAVHHAKQVVNISAESRDSSMHIRSFILAGAGLAIGLTAPVSANGPARGGAIAARPPMHAGATVHRWGPRPQGRWRAGGSAPGDRKSVGWGKGVSVRVDLGGGRSS